MAGRVPPGVSVRPICSLLRETMALACSQGVAGESQVYRNQLLQVNCSVPGDNRLFAPALSFSVLLRDRGTTPTTDLIWL